MKKVGFFNYANFSICSSISQIFREYNFGGSCQLPVLLALMLFAAGYARANSSPKVTVSVSSGSYTDPATITFNATATDSDGTIKSVKFYNGALLIGTASSTGGGNYTFTWANVSEGVYTIKAKATDNLKGRAMSSPITVTVVSARQDHTLDTVMDNGTRYRDSVFSISNIKVTKNITYGSALDNLGNLITLTLDVYEPNQIVDPERHRPLVIVIHGGGFVHGNSTKPDIVERARDWFAKRGYVAASINYRLRANSGNEIEDEVRATSDAQAAVRFFRAHAEEYHIDPNRIITYGRSAGAITSEMVGISSELDGSWETLYPTVDENMCNPGFPSWVVASFAEAGRIDSEFLSLHLDPTDVGTVVDFHGTFDTTVPYEEGVHTINTIASEGIFAELYSYNAEHLNFSPTDEFDIESKTIEILFDRVIAGDQCPAPNMNVPQIQW